MRSRSPPAPRPASIPPSSFLFDRAADPPVPYDPAAAQMALTKAGWTNGPDGWRLPRAKAALTIELLSPDLASNPAAFRTAEVVAGDWKAIGLQVTHVPLPPGEFVTGRLATGKFSAAVGDVTIGLDPDLYPLLGVEPDRDRRLERHRAPGSGARQAPPRRPRPGHAARADRRLLRRSRSSWRRADTCSRWPSRTSRSWSATRSRERPSARSPTRLIDFGMC